VHGDLKCDSLLICETDTVRIADFGLAKQLANDFATHTNRIPAVRRGHDRKSIVYAPLVEMRNRHSPHALGTSRWRALELSRRGA
jgi:serine/threonine protein kinase